MQDLEYIFIIKSDLKLHAHFYGIYKELWSSMAFPMLCITLHRDIVFHLHVFLVVNVMRKFIK